MPVTSEQWRIEVGKFNSSRNFTQCQNNLLLNNSFLKAKLVQVTVLPRLAIFFSVFYLALMFFCELFIFNLYRTCFFHCLFTLSMLLSLLYFYYIFYCLFFSSTAVDHQGQIKFWVRAVAQYLYFLCLMFFCSTCSNVAIHLWRH